MLPRTSRILGALVATSLVLLSACGDSPDEKSDTTEAASSATDAATSDTGAATDASTTEDTAAAETTAAALPKPEVEIPAELPTELVITDLTEGTGDGAVAGDTVTVHYVGVRSADGTEFDNSYDRGQPFPVTLGAGGVIAGWDEGLLGVKVGGRRQLDIPADLAYGDTPQGDIIQAGDALTFVIDVVSITPAPEPLSATNPDDAPTLTIEGAANVDEMAIDDLIVGEGEELTAGAQAAVHIIAYRADTGEEINSTWSEATPIAVILDPAQLLPGLVTGITGMHVGGRRQIRIPFAEGFGAAGNPDMGLPENTDMVLVVDAIKAL